MKWKCWLLCSLVFLLFAWNIGIMWRYLYQCRYIQQFCFMIRFECHEIFFECIYKQYFINSTFRTILVKNPLWLSKSKFTKFFVFDWCSIMFGNRTSIIQLHSIVFDWFGNRKVRLTSSGRYALSFSILQKALLKWWWFCMPIVIHLSRNSNLWCARRSPPFFKITQKEVKRLGACLRKPVFSTFFIFHCV